MPDSEPQSATNGSQPQPAAASLDPADWPAFRAQAHRMLDDMLGYTEGIREQPVWQKIPSDVRAQFRSELPAQPSPLQQVHEEFMTSILPFTARNGHPGFLGWVQGGGTPVGMMAELLAAGLNANLGGRDQIPLEVERQVTEWMRTLFGFPEGATGLFVTGTSMANFLAVKVARDARLGVATRRKGVNQAAQKLTAYASTAVHGCIARALDLAGLGSDSLRPVAVDSRHRIDVEALAHAVRADREAGLTPFLVVGTAGTVDTGAIDDLDALADFCAAQQLWFHVDGAFGALGMLAPDVAPRLKGIERADSLGFDFHKWAQVPYDSGFILMRDGRRHRESFAAPSAYLSREDRGMAAGSPWPCDFGPDLSRGFRALKTWATLKVYGTDAMGAVISRSCQLARSLEARIAATPELQLLAPVELNIVCFRYRGRVQEREATQPDPPQSDTAADEMLNHLNRQIVVELHEAGAIAPSTTLIDGRVAIRAAMVNHRTTQAEVDTLVASVLATGRALLQGAPSASSGQQQWKPWFARNEKLQKIDAELAVSLPKDAEVNLRYARAMLLMQLGRTLEARSEHLKVVELDPAHERNLNALGLLCAVTGHRKAALLTLAEAVKHHPESKTSRVNYGGVLLEEKDAVGAREQFEAALRIDPDLPQGHAGLYYALSQLGDSVSAAHHRRIGFGQKNVFTNLYRGNAQPVPVLMLVSSTGGNAPIEKQVDDTVFQTHTVVADFYNATQPLPPHRLVINAIGDPDVSQHALVAAESILAHTTAPVLNAPSAVMATGRCQNAARLSALHGVIAPKTKIFPYSALAAANAAELLLAEGFTFPLLLRAPGYHMGEHFVQVESATDLAAAVAGLPSTGRSEHQLLAIEYLDARGADGFSRKYRVMMIGGELYPLHLAISPHWKIHYFSADMAENADHREEEGRFISDMAGVLGSHAMEALERIQATMALDYAGIDFALDRQGNVLLFEANATMVVEPPDQREQWDYRRAAVARVQKATGAMLMRMAGAVTPKGAKPNSVPAEVATSPR